MKNTERAQQLVDVVIDGWTSTHNDAGWHQPSVLQRLIEYKGDLPPPSGNDQADLKMINEIRYVTTRSKRFKLYEMIFKILPEQHQQVLLADRFYRRRVDDAGNKYTEPMLAAMLEISAGTYRQRKSEGYASVEAQLKVIDQLRDLGVQVFGR